MNAEEANQEALKARQRKQQLSNAWKRLLATEDGKLVWEDLRSRFRLNARVFQPVQGPGHFQYDPLTAALTDGGRSVVIYIHEHLTAPIVGDANISKTKTKVKKATPST